MADDRCLRSIATRPGMCRLSRPGKRKKKNQMNFIWWPMVSGRNVWIVPLLVNCQNRPAIVPAYRAAWHDCNRTPERTSQTNTCSCNSWKMYRYSIWRGRAMCATAILVGHRMIWPIRVAYRWSMWCRIWCSFAGNTDIARCCATTNTDRISYWSPWKMSVEYSEPKKLIIYYIHIFHVLLQNRHTNAWWKMVQLMILHACFVRCAISSK